MCDNLVVPEHPIIFAIFGGLLPALIWLWFWLREDKISPEPKKLIIFTFLLGAVTVPIAAFLEKYTSTFFGAPLPDPTNISVGNLALSGIFLYGIWALIEEVMKLSAAWLGGLRTKANDEPIDAIIYVITAALGFAAFENSGYIYRELTNNGVLMGLFATNSRFIGATLLHTLSSAVVGVTMAFTFYKHTGLKKIIGIIIALLFGAIIHTLFNLFTIYGGGNAMFVVLFIWGGIATLIVVFEKVKEIRNYQQHT
jgi:protease PrsW